jgi:hypothetical protein
MAVVEIGLAYMSDRELFPSDESGAFVNIAKGVYYYHTIILLHRAAGYDGGSIHFISALDNFAPESEGFIR